MSVFSKIPIRRLLIETEDGTTFEANVGYLTRLEVTFIRGDEPETGHYIANFELVTPKMVVSMEQNAEDLLGNVGGRLIVTNRPA